MKKYWGKRSRRHIIPGELLWAKIEVQAIFAYKEVFGVIAFRDRSAAGFARCDIREKRIDQENMDRGRRAEPYSNATIWTREIARNLAGHLSRVSNAHSCVDTRSPKSTHLPQFHHSHVQKRCPTSPMKTRQHLATISRPSEHENDLRSLGGGSAREETDGAPPSYKVEINQEVSDRRVRIPAVKPPARQNMGNGMTVDATTYDAPLVLPHQRNRLAHDYYKRQEQRKIWQENQAFIKRLQSTKATLNSKEWEKDGKWTQEFLKNQEKRRSALQQELRRAQVSPQAVLRSKPLKSLYTHHLKSTPNHAGSDKDLDVSSPTKTGVVGVLSARSSSKGQIQQGSQGSSEAIVQQASAANHRRIMELRKQKLSPRLAHPVESSSTGLSTPDTINPDTSDETAYIPDNEIVSVRFTFSRGRSRGTDSSSGVINQADPPGSLDVYESDRDMMSLSGAFSPGVELETALNAVAVRGTNLDPPECDQPIEVVADTHEDSTIAIEAQLQEVDDRSSDAVGNVINVAGGTSEVEREITKNMFHTEDEGIHVDNVDFSPPASAPEDAVVATRSQDDSDEMSAVTEPEQAEDVASLGNEKEKSEVDGAHGRDEEWKSPPFPKEQQTQQVSSADEEDEAYDGDNFDEDGLPSARTAEELPQVNDNHEVSGYGSEFEEEPGSSSLSIVNTAVPAANQDEGNDEDEYSHDDFVD